MSRPHLYIIVAPYLIGVLLILLCLFQCSVSFTLGCHDKMIILQSLKNTQPLQECSRRGFFTYIRDSDTSTAVQYFPFS